MRVKGVRKPADYPSEYGGPTDPAIVDMFATLFPGVADPRIDEGHLGLAVAAYNPRLALQLAALSKFLAVDAGWSKRADLRELAIQTANINFRSDYSFETRRPIAKAMGISDEQLDLLAEWQTSDLFDAEQKLVIEYSEAVASGDVSAALFATVVDTYGERGAIEFTSVVAIWSAWAMILNAVRPEGEPAA
ncbi:hypothetical protein PQ455_18080 [Sphingomonas naphthae]|uniref:Carboxymuconolactone decarboxylase family protein n=1 Tax=Sphingomonas naphthae TaxID=1813468 RepID=A0ABY7TJV4_9SPHN|nr:hypothetical protein [Sphingomonas naphthae]WCT73490.1 hypothetical protein PQ455_18080 [Sphingomonas naphthae]